MASLTAAAEGSLPTGNDRRRLVRRVRAAGVAAVPALIRALVSACDGEARWAHYLLARVGQPDRPRVVERLSKLIEDPRIPDETKGRVSELIADLSGMPAGPPTARYEHQLTEAVVDFLDALLDEKDVGLAVELVTREVPEDEVVAFVSEVARHGGRMAVPLLDGLIAGHQQTTPTLDAIGALRDLLLAQPEPVETVAVPPQPMPALDLSLPSLGDEPPCERRVRPRHDTPGAPRQLGFALLERGEYSRARPPLEAAAAADPDDGEALSYLGVCLLHLGEPEPALVHLEHAAALDPDEAIHQWNLAAAAKAAEQLCRSYLALERYLTLDDGFEGARNRRREARRFLIGYQKLIRAMHPGVAFDEVLRGEELFQAAFAELESRRYPEAVAGFHGVLAILPHHYPSWGNLGAAELALGNHVDAARCLRRALELKPDYQIALENLKLLEARN